MIVLYLFSLCSPLIPIIAGRRKWRHLLWIYAMASMTFDLCSAVFKRILHWNHIPVINTFSIIEAILLFYYFKNKAFPSNALFYVTISLVLVSAAVYFPQNNNWSTFNSIPISSAYVIYILLCIGSFYRILTEQKIVFLERSSAFWGTTAIFIYASGSFFLFLAINKFKNDAGFQWVGNILFLSLNILKNILLAIALSKKGQY